MSEGEGFEAKWKLGEPFVVRCKKYGCSWKGDDDWLALMLKHAKHHATQHRTITIKT
jgi:hypothetical protein